MSSLEVFRLSPPPATNIQLAPGMSLPTESFCGEAFLRLCRALPRSPGKENLPVALELARLQLRSTALLPTHAACGLGAGQQAVVAEAVNAVQLGVARALETPKTHLTLAYVSLLRGLARGSAASETERAFVPHGHALPHEFRTHRHAPYTTLKEFADGLAFAELSYEVLLEGQRRLRALATQAFFEGLDGGLHWASMCNVAWALPVLFDGLRLRRGLAAATPCVDELRLLSATEDNAEEREDLVAARFLSDGASAVDHERVLCGALFFLAASRAALEHYTPPSPYKHCGPGHGSPEDNPVHHWHHLEADIRLGLERCREESEKRAQQPGKAMRVVLERFAALLEDAIMCPGTRTLVRLAFAYPCLVPSGLQHLEYYDGGLLSVWDACLHLLELHAQLHKEVLQLHTLMCAVLGGAVGNLVAPAELAGPFIVHPKSDVMARVTKVRAAWPASRGVGGSSGNGGGGGKMVGANAVLCESVATGQYRGQLPASNQCVTRADAALTMQVFVEGLGPGAHTTDTVQPLKRLYLAALHFEPGMPEGPTASASGGPALETSPLCPPGTLCATPCSVPVELTDSVWRDVTGAAVLCSGALYCFTRRALADSLDGEWVPTEAMQQALRDRQLDAPGRGASVMTPAAAMSHVARRAHAHVMAAATVVEVVTLSTDGPRNVTRAVDSLTVWACGAYSASAVSGALWESVLVACCPSVKRKSR